jgi:hypothetical protein
MTDRGGFLFCMFARLDGKIGRAELGRIVVALLYLYDRKEQIPEAEVIRKTHNEKSCFFFDTLPCAAFLRDGVEKTGESRGRGQRAVCESAHQVRVILFVQLCLRFSVCF